MRPSGSREVGCLDLRINRRLDRALSRTDTGRIGSQKRPFLCVHAYSPAPLGGRLERSAHRRPEFEKLTRPRVPTHYFGAIDLIFSLLEPG